MRIKLILLALAATSLFSTCDTGEPDLMSTTPEINIEGVSPTTVKSFSQPIVVTIGYKDGNGDLGYVDPDTYSIYVQDSRLNYEDEYHLHPLAPSGSAIPIQGSVDVELHKTFLLGGGGSEVITYKIRLRDRAGNWSNTVTTPSITITP